MNVGNSGFRSIRFEIEYHLKSYWYTLVNLGELTGINPGNISEILRNKRAMTIGHIDSFAKAFGYEAGWLYDLYAKEECIYDGKVSRARAVPCFPFCFCWIMNFKYPKSNTSAKSLL